MPRLAQTRAAYAEMLRREADLRSARLVEALGRVAREDFVGPPPWQLIELGRGLGFFEQTDDPARLYGRVLVVIDADKGLNNGEPGALASWIDALELAPGERVAHVGCGVGYYTALLAELVGPQGQVLALDIEAPLVARAKRNLARYRQVEVRCCDGASADIEPCDAIFVNAGATRPRDEWLDALRPGGRLLLPLTVDATELGAGAGYYLLVTRQPGGHAARFISPVGVYPCIGARDAEEGEHLRDAYGKGDWQRVRSLRRDAHEPSAGCWLHESGYCLSADLPPDGPE